MINITRAIAVGAAFAALAFTPFTASARSCADDRDRAGCAGSAASAPMQLDKFMQTWKPASVARSGKRTRTVRRSHHRGETQKVASERKSQSRQASRETAGETKVADAQPSPVAMEIPAPAAVTPAASAPESTLETDGVAVTSYSDVNEVDQAAHRIQVVAFNEVNEIDLAAPPPPAAETVSQAFAQTPEPADNSWIGKLLLAAAATIALAGGARLLVT